MRKVIPVAVAAALVALVVSLNGATPVPKKKSGKSTASKATTSKSTASKKGRKTAARSAPKPVARQRQVTPTPERYKEIQEALSAKGYLPPQQANGQWNEASADALKRFQADQNLDATGKINSLSLIALGLGPKHDSGPPAAPPDGGARVQPQ